MKPERIAPEHSWIHTARLLRLDLDAVQAFAFDCLEARGLRFCVHFGTKNAVEKASDEWLNRMARG